MGVKRPLDDQAVQVLPLKHSRQLDYSNKLTQFDDEVVPSQNVSQKPNILGEDMGEFCHSECEETFEDNISNEDADLINKDFETNAPFSWFLTTSSFEEEDRSGGTIQSPLSQEYFKSGFPQITSAHVGDTYSLLVDWSTRKKVPIGPNHQANIPIWGRRSKEEKLDKSGTSQPNYIVDEEKEKKLMGKCIIPMPDSNICGLKGQGAGEAKKENDCLCVDRGSIRCVRQHIMEAREELIETIGYEKFVKLGFCEIGEEVAHKWSEEDEDFFHEVVYSNPVSLGRNFWKHLNVAFPSRTKKELVSFYFNVFILRRRVVQNRSKSLDIDSDDDDWHASYEDSCGVQVPEEDENSAVESTFHQDIGEDHNRGCIPDEDDRKEDDDDDDDDDDGDGCEGYVGEDSTDATKEDASDDYSFDLATQHGVKVSGNSEEDSCTSFDFKSNMVDACNSAVAGPTILAMEENTDLGKWLENKLDGSNNLVTELYIFETSDTRFPTASTKGVDFLPTSNIIEEIFGQETWDDLTRSK